MPKMEDKVRSSFEASSNSQSMHDPSKTLNQDHTFSQFNSRNLYYNSDHEVKNRYLDWDPRAVLTNLSFLEQKIHQVQGIVRSIINHNEGHLSINPRELAAQKQLVTADLTCIMAQLMSITKNTVTSSTPATGQLGNLQQKEGNSLVEAKASEYEGLVKSLGDCEGEGNEPIQIEDHDVKDSEDGVDGENIPLGSYEVLQLEKEEILAPHTHFCAICGKGFKRDANLRMHMRGHGDEYKTPAALAKPVKELGSEPVPIKRYSCPFVGCKRNKNHKKFQPLKTILCVKNHYKRSHCDKSYTCSRCNSKKFSVLADLKTHEKHCGRDKWLCSCGTTFSRKDKLFGHVALFQGHTPAIPLDESKGPTHGSMNATAAVECSSAGFVGNLVDDINILEDDRGYFSPMNFESCNFGGFDDFARQFDVGESSFCFLPPGSGNFAQKSTEREC